MERDMDGLLGSLEMYIKRMLYTQNKRLELEEAKHKAKKLQDMQEQMKVTMV